MSTDLAKMLLGLERGTLSKDVISKAFKEKSRVCHPDTGGDAATKIGIGKFKNFCWQLIL